MKVTKTLIPTDAGEILLADTITFEAAIWIVPMWLEVPTQGWKRPARIVRISGFRRQKTPAGFPAPWLLGVSIPRAVLDGLSQSSGDVRFEVREEPDIRVAIPKQERPM